ncbi:MAG: hypothetical protein HY820_45155 [Acidobacteria bacterium]|nr:hypothetical protein [Acidobacteriota bacterium]
MLLLLALLIGSAGAQTGAGLIGVGIGPGGEGARTRMFADLGRVFRPFQRADGTRARIDESGWPVEDGSVVLFDIRPVPAWAPPIDDPAQFQPDWSGAYALSFRGQADVASTGGSGFRVENLSWDPETNLTTGDVVADPGAGLLVLSFRNTRRTPESAANSGITELRFIRPGYDRDNPPTFTDEFLAALAPFRVLRFMGFVEANNTNPLFGDADNITHWAERHVPSDATQQMYGRKRGFAWEYAIQICNLSGKDIWINIPVAADDDYIQNLAKLLHEQLDPSLTIYIEYSNEVWNPGFTQYTYNLAAADAEVAAGGSPLNSDGNRDRLEWARRRALKRLIDASRIFSSEFDDPSRLRPVYSWWTIFPDQYRNVLQWAQAVYGAPSTYLWAIAKTNYYNDRRAARDASPEAVLDAMRADSDNGRTYTSRIKQVADLFGLQFVTYEAGPDNGGGSTVNIGNRILANRLPAMRELMLRDVRDNWFELGGGLYMLLELSSAYSRYGCWGQNEDVIDLTTPKYQAVLELSEH